MAEAGRYGTIHWGAPPAGLEDYEGGGEPAPPTALGTGVAAPLAGLEKNYEQSANWVVNKVKPYTSFPNSPNWGMLAGFSPVAGIIPRSLPELMALGAAGGTPALQEAFLPREAIEGSSYGMRAARNAMRPGIPAIAGGGTAALTGQNVPNNMAMGAAVGGVGAAEDVVARRLIGSESSPYIRQFLQRQGRELAGSLNRSMPNVFSGVRMQSASDLMTAFTQPFNKLPWVQSLYARYAGRQLPRQVANILKQRLEEYNVLGEFFQNPDNYTEDGRAIDPLKLKQWIIKNGAKVPERMANTFENLMRTAWGLRPNDPLRLTGLDIMPEAGHLGARLHQVPYSETRNTPLNIIMHYGFGKLGKFVGNQPELTPSWWKQFLTQALASRAMYTEAQDFPTADNTSMPHGPSGDTH